MLLSSVKFLVRLSGWVVWLIEWKGYWLLVHGFLAQLSGGVVGLVEWKVFGPVE